MLHEDLARAIYGMGIILVLVALLFSLWRTG
jgi:hypothetical protein